jgi:hypothetical protein
MQRYFDFETDGLTRTACVPPFSWWLQSIFCYSKYTVVTLELWIADISFKETEHLNGLVDCVKAYVFLMFEIEC